MHINDFSRADTETRQLVLTPGDHVTVFSAPATAQDTRFLELSVKPNSKATASIPGDSGWAYGSAVNNKNILVDQCDSDPANNSMTLSYQGGPLGEGAYSFLTFIDDGLITYCGEGGSTGSNPDHSFTLLITDENTVLILPNPAYAAVSTEQASNWIELKALRWEFENGANKEIPTVVDWAPVFNLSCSQTKEGPAMTDEQVDAYEGTTIWVKSNTPGIYTVLASTLEESGTAGKVITGTLNILSVELTAYRPQTNGPGYGNPFQKHEVPNDQEENPGAGIRINGNTETAVNENDLIEVELEVAPFRPAFNTSSVATTAISRCGITGRGREPLCSTPARRPRLPSRLRRCRSGSRIPVVVMLTLSWLLRTPVVTMSVPTRSTSTHFPVLWFS